MMTIRMTYHVTITEDGFYHVQNVVMGHLGQHHVHTKKGYEFWLKNINNKEDIKVSKGKCNCDLNAGDVREYDGHIWHKQEFE